MKLIILLGILAVFVPAQVARAQTPAADPFAYRNDPLYQQFDNSALTGGAAGVLPQLDRQLKEDPRSLAVIAGWLKDNSVAFFALKKNISGFDSIYWAKYFDILMPAIAAEKKAGATSEYQSLSQTALLALYGYEVLVLADASRCDDVSVAGPIQETLGFRIKAIQDVYSFTSKEDMQQFWNLLIKVEEHSGRRPPNKVVCSSGAAKMADMLRQPGVRTQEHADPNYIGGKTTEVIPPPGYIYQPKYIDDNTWSIKRKEIRDKMPVVWRQRYEASQKQTQP
jgi:hypothetical protein